ncbi:MAG: hypothetical protein JWQ12_1777 [Glaciihabitans sp.]|nr:hypothetical protein [Glaciihabitans sp.]
MTELDCPFCEIVQLEDPDAREVFRNEHVIAFFPTEPATLGHTLVIPRKHIAGIWEIDDATATQLSRVTLKLAHAIRDAVKPEGLNLIQSNGEAATQTVNHLHIHLVPRWESDGIGRIWPRETNFSERQKDDALERVRDALRIGMAKG